MNPLINTRCAKRLSFLHLFSQAVVSLKLSRLVKAWKLRGLSITKLNSKMDRLLSSHVRPVLQYGLSAIKAHWGNKSHVIGDILILLGVVSFFIYLLFPEPGHDANWYYGNWFYYFFSVRIYLILIFWGTANYFYTESKTYKFINYLKLSGGLVGLTHYSFFVTDDVSYHEFNLWWVIAVCISVGFGIIQSLQHLVYIWEHKAKGNHCRFVGVAEQDLPIQQKDRIFKQLAREYRDLRNHY